MKKNKSNHMLTSQTKAAIIICVMLSLTGCFYLESNLIKKTPTTEVDLSFLKDGTYFGDFNSGSFTYEVEVVLENRKIIQILIISNRKTKYAKKAEGVIKTIIEKQTPHVDAITGATVTSKALMKAVENALLSGEIKLKDLNKSRS